MVQVTANSSHSVISISWEVSYFSYQINYQLWASLFIKLFLFHLHYVDIKLLTFSSSLFIRQESYSSRRLSDRDRRFKPLQRYETINSDVFSEPSTGSMDGAPISPRINHEWVLFIFILLSVHVLTMQLWTYTFYLYYTMLYYNILCYTIL
jgi:hypothetical protein